MNPDGELKTLREIYEWAKKTHPTKEVRVIVWVAYTPAWLKINLAHETLTFSLKIQGVGELEATTVESLSSAIRGGWGRSVSVPNCPTGEEAFADVGR